MCQKTWKPKNWATREGFLAHYEFGFNISSSSTFIIVNISEVQRYRRNRGVNTTVRTCIPANFYLCFINTDTLNQINGALVGRTVNVHKHGDFLDIDLEFSLFTTSKVFVSKLLSYPNNRMATTSNPQNNRSSAIYWLLRKGYHSIPQKTILEAYLPRLLFWDWWLC